MKIASREDALKILESTGVEPGTYYGPPDQQAVATPKPEPSWIYSHRLDIGIGVIIALLIGVIYLLWTKKKSH